ncbi:MAG: hypothetical protein WCT46_03240 [Candidatus Gracilibacteria bacterium]|jgi:hypothetical protein
MQKFTVFTIIFSAIVIVTVSELVVHDYFDRHSGEVAEVEEVVEVGEVNGENIQASIIDIPSEPEITSILSGLDYTAFGFVEGSALKDKNFPEKVFQFLEFDNNDSEGMYWEMFADVQYEGGLYEIICGNPTAAFTVYTDLKASALSQEGSGTINEVNNYGLASFYFNDNIKSSTVFLVILGEDRVYAFSYPSEMHERFKGIADSL